MATVFATAASAPATIGHPFFDGFELLGAHATRVIGISAADHTLAQSAPRPPFEDVAGQHAVAIGVQTVEHPFGTFAGLRRRVLHEFRPIDLAVAVSVDLGEAVRAQRIQVSGVDFAAAVDVERFKIGQSAAVTVFGLSNRGTCARHDGQDSYGDTKVGMIHWVFSCKLGRLLVFCSFNAQPRRFRRVFYCNRRDTPPQGHFAQSFIGKKGRMEGWSLGMESWSLGLSRMKHADFRPVIPTASQERDARKAMLRGWRGRCPSCGNGPMMKSYLKVRDKCAVCDQELYHHRADDGPAYLTILIVGHVMAPLLIWVYTNYEPDPMIVATTFSIGCVALSLYLLPRLKGAIVGLQWAKRLYGFGRSTGEPPR